MYNKVCCVFHRVKEAPLGLKVLQVHQEIG